MVITQIPSTRSSTLSKCTYIVYVFLRVRECVGMTAPSSYQWVCICVQKRAYMCSYSCVYTCKFLEINHRCIVGRLIDGEINREREKVRKNIEHTG